MAEFDDNAGESGGAEEGTPRHFDPLFGWDERDDAPSSRQHDDLFDLAPVEASEEEEIDWRKPYRPAGDAYPDRHQPTYEQRLTELQQRLRSDTVVVARPESRWVVTVRELAETLLLALLIFLAVRASFQNFKVEGASMQPSLANGEYLIVNKLSYAQLDTGFLDWLPFIDGSDGPEYLWSKPARGDIVVFSSPTATSRDFIKRIIGVPGDTLTIDSAAGGVRVNGLLLDEPYIQGTTSCGETCEYTIPEAGSDEAFNTCGSSECYFVMGDNRQNSSDSRQGWLVPKENIIGKTLITYWNEGKPEFNLAPNHSIGAAEEAGD